MSTTAEKASAKEGAGTQGSRTVAKKSRAEDASVGSAPMPPSGHGAEPCASPAERALLPDLLSPAARADRFDRICRQAMQERRQNTDAGIGMLAEKWQHQIIKRYLTEDKSLHEVRVPGTRYVSDVRVGDCVYEVQTGSFAPMQKKLAYYLEHTDLTVTVVHPIPKSIWVSRIDPNTAEISPRRRVPRHKNEIDLLPALYHLRELLPNPRLRFRILCLEVQDFRLTPPARGRKKSGARFERIPLTLLEDRSFTTPQELLALLPEAVLRELPEVFTVRELSALSRLRGMDAYSAVRVLLALGAVAPAEPRGRAMAFCRLF